MKKTVKALVIAASVAAVAGIGAVSFAKWQVDTSKNKAEVPSNTTGTESVIQFTDTSVFTAITGLKPLDQDTSITSANYTEIKFKVTASEGYDKSDFKVNIKIDSDTTLQSASGIYVASEAPSATASSGKVTTTGVDLTYNLNSNAETEYSIFVWLQSDDIKDMNKTFKLTYEIVAGATNKV